MDVNLSPVKKNNFIYLFLFVIIVVLGFYVFYSLNKVTIEKKELVLKKVKLDSLNTSGKGFGYFSFKSNEKISSQVKGTVSTIFAYTGDDIKKGQKLLQLTNTELSFRLEQKNNELEQLILNEEESNMNLDLKLSNVSNTVKKYGLRKDVLLEIKNSTYTLFKKGIISRNNYLLKESEYKLMLLDLQNIKDKYQQLKKSKIKKREIYKKKLKFEKKKLKKAEKEILSLTIYSPINGVIKDLKVQKGDKVNTEEILIILSGKVPDIATLDFPQYYLNNLHLGGKVILHYNKNQIESIITRIEPTIKDGYIRIEVSFNKTKAKEAVNNMSVSGELFLKTIEKSLYIQKPSYYSESSSFLYVLVNDSLVRKEVEAEAVSESYLIIHSGVKEGDLILVSNHNELNDKPEKIIIN